MKMSGKHLWCEWPIALIRTPYMLTSGTDIIMMTGFEECMSTFSQEKMALNTVCEDSCDGGSYV